MRPCWLPTLKLLILKTFIFSWSNCCCNQPITSSRLSAAVPVDEDAEVVEVKDFSMEFACSKSSFMVEFSAEGSSSLTFELVEDESSPSIFWTFGRCGDPCPLSLGRVHAGAICSVIPPDCGGEDHPPPRVHFCICRSHTANSSYTGFLQIEYEILNYLPLEK